MKEIISTVSTIFKERYGTQLKIERSFNIPRAQSAFAQRWHSPFVYSRTLRQVSFPIFNSKRELKAIATASPVENQDAIIFEEMSQFLQLTIAEHMDLTERREIQVNTQVAIEQAHVDRRKVVQLQTRKEPLRPHFTFKKTEPKKAPDLRPLWISGDNENFNAHIAFSIHDWAANWAFINAKEIPDLVWEDPHSWQNFPQVTLFVPNIVTLSANKIEILQKNLERLKQNKGPAPLVIITSPIKISPELEKLKKQFKHYQANDKVSARVQAHFLLYHHQNKSPWVHEDVDGKGVYFLPFSPTPTRYH